MPTLNLKKAEMFTFRIGRVGMFIFRIRWVGMFRLSLNKEEGDAHIRRRWAGIFTIGTVHSLDKEVFPTVLYRA